MYVFILGQLEINSKTPRQIGKTPRQILNPHAKHQDRGNHNSRREASKIQYQPASRNSSKLWDNLILKINNFYYHFLGSKQYKGHFDLKKTGFFKKQPYFVGNKESKISRDWVFQE